MKRSRTLIFVVDDNEYNLMEITKELRKRLTCNVLGFTSAKDCIASFYKKPDLILSDHYLDGEYKHQMSGAQMLSYFKTRSIDIPVIMYSSKASIDLVVKLLQGGAAGFIPREENFITKATNVIKSELIRIKEQNEMQRDKRIIIVSVIVFSFIVFLMQLIIPHGLPYFFLGMIIVGIIMAFFGKQIIGKIRNLASPNSNANAMN